MPLAIRGTTKNSFEDLNENRDPKKKCDDAKALRKQKDGNKEDFLLQQPKYSLHDIILCDSQKREIDLVIGYQSFKDKLLYQWGLNKCFADKNGLVVNLYGESGTGKTMTAHAIAYELNKPLLIVNYAEIESKYVGETSKNLTKLFHFAEESNAVLLLDEADALLSRRVTNMTNSTDVSVNQTKSVLLNILNTFTGIVIFTTNFISNYDHAFMRRITFQIKFSLPDFSQRKRIWKYYLVDEIPYDLDIDKMANKYDNISCSDISNCIWNAALHAAMDHKNIINEEYFASALEQILLAKKENNEKEPKIISQREVSEEYALKQINKQNIKTD